MTTTGQQIRAARERAGLTQERLAQLVGVTHRTVGNWERGASVPRNRLAKVREVLPDLDGDDRSATLHSASDAEVLAEIARRFARTERGEGNVRAPSMNDAERGSATDAGKRVHVNGDVPTKTFRPRVREPHQEPDPGGRHDRQDRDAPR